MGLFCRKFASVMIETHSNVDVVVLRNTNIYFILGVTVLGTLYIM